MKVGMVSEFYYPQPGGISEHIRSVARELRLMGHEVVVLTSHIRGAVPEPGQRVIRLGRSLPVRYNGSLSRVSLGWQLGGRLDRVLAQEDFDLLHIHNPLMPTLPLLTLRRARCPLVATFHSFYRRDLLTQLFRRQLTGLLQRLDARIPVSAAAHRAVDGAFPGDYRVIPNGVDIDFFSPATRQNGKRPLRILFVGAHVPRKGLPHLIEAFGRLRRRKREVLLTVVGSGPENRRLQRSIPPELRDCVRCTGFIPRASLAAEYAAADIFCAPSLGSESFGMVLLEAMAAGLPIVAYDIDGYRDVVRHESEGLLVEHRNTAALADALEFFLDRPQERVRYGLRGRQRAQEYSWRQIAHRLDQVYREVLGLPVQPRVEISEAHPNSPRADRAGSERTDTCRPV